MTQPPPAPPAPNTAARAAEAEAAIADALRSHPEPILPRAANASGAVIPMNRPAQGQQALPNQTHPGPTLPAAGAGA